MHIIKKKRKRKRNELKNQDAFVEAYVNTIVVMATGLAKPVGVEC